VRCLTAACRRVYVVHLTLSPHIFLVNPVPLVVVTTPSRSLFLIGSIAFWDSELREHFVTALRPPAASVFAPLY
jgi:hypothetical protein